MSIYKVIFTVLLLFGIVSAQTVEISFDQLGDYFIQNSPKAKELNLEYKILSAESKMDLQWKNPQIVVEQENLKNSVETDKEFVAAVEKEITLPWKGSLHRAAWQEQLKAADYTKQARLYELISKIKFDYVKILLFRQKFKSLHEIENIIGSILQITEDRFKQGTLSGLQQQLIQLSLQNLQSSLIKNKLNQQELLNHFKLDLGLHPGDEIALTDKIVYQAVTLPSEKQVSELIKLHPSMMSLKHFNQAAEKRLNMEKNWILPELSVSGGYKKVNSDLDGFVVGLSFPLPVLNNNRAQIQKQKAEYDMSLVKAQKYRQELFSGVLLNMERVQVLGAYFEKFSPSIQNKKSVDDLYFSFQEGWSDIGDVMDGIQVYSENLDQYYENLVEYYQSVFQLEALLARDFVRL